MVLAGDCKEEPDNRFIDSKFLDKAYLSGKNL